MNTTHLKWNHGNAKLPSRIIHFSLPSGHSCPAADKCRSQADQHTGKITDGPHTEYRCYAAMQEARHPAVRKLRWHNKLLLHKRSSKDMFKMLFSSLKPLHDNYIRNHGQRPIIRAHVGGDFFNKSYWRAWLRLAETFEPTWFYAYTKRLDLWHSDLISIPPNFELNASRGGLYDDYIYKYNMKSAEVVYSIQEATQKGLELDHDDSHAYKRGPSFAQLIHGTQPAGSKASKALTLLKLSGITGYNANTKTMPPNYHQVLRVNN